MNNKYNVMVTYTGEGTFKFTLRKIGEVEISSVRPVYIYNADVDTINNLRALRRLRIEIHIGVKPNGAYRIFNMDDYETPRNVQVREHVNANYKAEPISNAEISSILKGGAQEVVTKEDRPQEPEKKTTKKETAAKKPAAKKTTATKKTTKK